MNERAIDGEAAPELIPRGHIALMVLAGLVARLATVAFLYRDHLDPSRHNWEFGWEMGMVAQSLAAGHGFGSPFPGGTTGPTAMLLPVYPAILAAALKIFGGINTAAVVAVMAVNSLLSALTAVPVFLLARREFGTRVAIWAGWIWAFFPYGVYLAGGRVWDTQAITLLLAWLLYFTYRLAESFRISLWLLYGVLWGLAALTNPSLLVVLPVLLGVVCYRWHRNRQPWFARAVIVALILAAMVTPWEIRNYRVFHQFIPLRDNFWMEVRIGNTGDLSNIDPDWTHPWWPARFQEFQQWGELGFIAESRRQAVDFISRYPGMFAWITAKHVVFTWTGFWSLDPAYTREEPMQIPNVIFCSFWTVVMIFGLRRARAVHGWTELLPYLAVLALYPALFYISHPTLEYRHVVDPVVVVFSACALARWRTNSSLEKAKAQAG
ncbi:MAG: glycosyltransferase family 39 protein [Terriglobales bacterium]